MQRIVGDIYQGATSSVITEKGHTREIPILSGIRQGCPLSGLLFIMAIDPVVSLLQGTDADHRVLAFADDLCLIAEGAIPLQEMIARAQQSLERLGLHLNAKKCVTPHIAAPSWCT